MSVRAALLAVSNDLDTIGEELASCAGRDAELRELAVGTQREVRDGIREIRAALGLLLDRASEIDGLRKRVLELEERIRPQ